MQVTSVPQRFTNHQVTVATPIVIDTNGRGTPFIGAIPGAGGTMKVEYSLTLGAAANPGSANWATWTPGAVSANTWAALPGAVTALRFTATVNTGSVEVSA